MSISLNAFVSAMLHCCIVYGVRSAFLFAVNVAKSSTKVVVAKSKILFVAGDFACANFVYGVIVSM